MRIDRDDIPDIADDYVLGLFDDAERHEVERAIERDPVLKAAVGSSRDRFLSLDAVVTPAAVDVEMWERIEAALPVQDTAATPAGVVSANDNNWHGWRMTAISAVAATVLLTIGLTYLLLRTTEPIVIAVLLNDRGGIHAVIEDFGDRNARVRLLESVDVPAGKTIQAWTLPSAEMGPVSIGLLKNGKSDTLELPPLPQPHADQLYELTLEDEGGSPTGRPTGTIIAKGFAKLPI